MKYCLAIDIGASSGRHIIGYIESGKLVLEEIHRFTNGATNKDGKLVWEVDRLFSEILIGLKKAKEIGKIPESVGIDTWGVDYALLDKNDKLIDGIYSYRDARTENSSILAEKIVPFSELYSSSGIERAVFNTVYQLYDDVLTGRIENAETFLTLPDYLNFLLTGEKKQEYTDATTTALVNSKTHTWDYEIIEKLSIPKKLFKTLSQPGETVGFVKKEIEEIIGYKPKIILPATHDTASAVLAVPDGGEHAPYISSGTWSLMGVEVEKAITKSSSDGKSYSNEGSINFNFRFQTNIMGMWIFQNVKKELDGGSFAELTAMAEKSSYKEIFDVNDKRFFAPKSMIEEINGYFLERNINPPKTAGDICRSIFESLAVCYAKTLTAISEITGKKFDKLHIIGGGSQNGLLNRLTAKATGITVVSGPTEATALGNIIVQLKAIGEINSINDGKDLIKKSFEIMEIK